ncbi:HK97-gp10 family putative phage morphogenesis protein [Dinoroseobacter sp. S124A]|uniref:HK97-gp10 family putative phage morphogenesis protein n=1 Tax=Dinoroseobacter sp. S124A TaxID=3415128 RepID=UPI003C7D15DC
MSIRIKNDRDVMAVLLTVAPREASNLNRTTVHGIAGDVRDGIKAVAPDNPYTTRGDIVRSTKAKRERGSRYYAKSSVRIETKRGGKKTAPYWTFIENGTVKMRARPFVRPLVEKTRPRLPMLYRKQFGLKLAARLARVSR